MTSPEAPRYPRIFGLRPRPPSQKVAPVPVSEWNWKPFLPEAAPLTPDTLPSWKNSVETNYRPSKRRQKVVLVFEQELFTEELLKWLDQEGLKYFALDYTQIYGCGGIDVRVGEKSSARLSAHGFELDLKDVAAILWSAPADASFIVPEDHLPLNDFVNTERWRIFLRDLRWLVPSDAIWMPSHPLNGSNEWQNKFSELALARSVGLRVPETICTDNPEVARRFIRRHGSRAMFREMIKRNPYLNFEVEPGRIETAHLGDVLNTPCIFQQYVEKRYELRTVLVGRKTFSARINSQSSKKARVNWKVYDNAQVSWERYDLPRKVEAALVRLADRLEINWASIDLIRGKDGQYYFLELNRPGSQYWLYPFVGINSAHEVARFLKSKL